MDVSCVGRNNCQSSQSTVLIKETRDRDGNHIIKTGRLLCDMPDQDEFLVQSDKVEKWSKDQSLTLKEYIQKQNKIKDFAALIMSAQAKRIENLENENTKLQNDLGENVNYVA